MNTVVTVHVAPDYEPEDGDQYEAVIGALDFYEISARCYEGEHAQQQKLLRAALHALNLTVNTPLIGSEFKDTYTLAGAISRHLTEYPENDDFWNKHPDNHRRDRGTHDARPR